MWCLAIGVVVMLVALDGVVLWRVRLARPVAASGAVPAGSARGASGSAGPPGARAGGEGAGVAGVAGTGPAGSVPGHGPKVSLCGSEHAPVDTSDPFAVTRYLEAMTRATRDRWLSALRDSDDTRERAAGLVLEGMLAEAGQTQPRKEETRDALVQFAVGAGDPLVYGLAWVACSRPDPETSDGACSQLSLGAWARLDPDNAVPWLLLAGEARDHHDELAELDAFDRAAAAHRVDAYVSSLLKVAAPTLPADASPLTRWYLGRGVVGIEGTLRPAYVREAVLRCTAGTAGTAVAAGRGAGAAAGAGMAAPAARAQCATLADAMVTQGTTLTDLDAGARVGAQAGWPAERVAAVLEERDALEQALAQTTPTRPEDQWSCDGVRLGNVYLTERVKTGELAAARAALASSGQTVQALAQRQREYVDTLYREALTGGVRAR